MTFSKIKNEIEIVYIYIYNYISLVLCTSNLEIVFLESLIVGLCNT